MKRFNSQMVLGVISFLILLGQCEVCGQAARGIARGAGAAGTLLPLVLGLIGNTAGIIAVMVAGFWARGKNQDDQGLAILVAAAGGLWSAYTWFGWPFATYTQSGWFGLTSSPVSEFSFLRLIGLGIFGLLGVFLSSIFMGEGKQKR